MTSLTIVSRHQRLLAELEASKKQNDIDREALVSSENERWKEIEKTMVNTATELEKAKAARAHFEHELQKKQLELQQGKPKTEPEFVTMVKALEEVVTFDVSDFIVFHRTHNGTFQATESGKCATAAKARRPIGHHPISGIRRHAGCIQKGRQRIILLTRRGYHVIERHLAVERPMRLH